MTRLLHKCLFVLILIAGPLKSYSQNLGFNMIGEAKRVIIPFDYHNNLIVIPVVLNNQLPLKFILDTGVQTTILTERAFSDILNLEYTKKLTISGIGGEKLVDAYVTNNVTLTMPGVRGKGHAMLVLEKDYLELRNYLGTEVHGILGYELFSRFIIKIDYDKKRLTLIDPRYFKPSKMYSKIPIKIQDTKPYAVCQMTTSKGVTKEVKLLVDSGASHGLILEESSDPDILAPEKHVISAIGRGLGGELDGKIGRIQSFQFNNKMKFDNMIATFPESNTFLDSLKLEMVFRHGSVGGEILSRFKVIFDFPHEIMYLKKGRQYKKTFSYNLSGIVVKAKGSKLNTFEIVDVRANSVGEQAGFKKGDILISINNIDVKELHLNHVVGFLNAKENKKLTIKVYRDGSRISSTFRLRSQI